MSVTTNDKKLPSLIRVEVFKTNVEEEVDAAFLTTILSARFGNTNIHFDLEDCDKILRIENEVDINDEVISILVDRGFSCEVLP